MVPAEPTVGAVTGETSDRKPLARALDARGRSVEVVSWKRAAWERYDAVVFRPGLHWSERPEAFVEAVRAAEAADVTTLNPASAVTWNTHRAYLRDLADAGASIVPTAFVERGADRSLRSILDERGWSEAVVKPAIRGRGRGVWRVSRKTIDESRFTDRLATSDQPVQAYLPEITDGLVSLTFVGGRYSHAFRAVSPADGFRTRPAAGGTIVPDEPSEAVIETASSVLAAAWEASGADRLPYARVDGVVRDGTFRTLEAELIAPYLGVEWADAGALLADDLLAALDRGTSSRESLTG